MDHTAFSEQKFRSIITYPSYISWATYYMGQNFETMSRMQPWDWMGWEHSRKFLIKCHFGQLNNLSQFWNILPVYSGENVKSCSQSFTQNRFPLDGTVPSWNFPPFNALRWTSGLKYIAVILTNDTTIYIWRMCPLVEC